MTNSSSDIADWDRNAEHYASTTWTTRDRVYAQLRETLWQTIGEISGKHVLDVGCGHGGLAAALDERGAHVLGIDGAPELVHRAKARCPGGRFLCHDLTTGLPALNQTFDLVTATMVLMDIPDLEPLFRDLQSYSRQGTRMLVTLNHPCFFYSELEQDPKDGSWFRKVKTYLSHEIWRIPSFGGHNHYHRPLTFYFELFRRSGFLVRRFFEPTPIPAPDAVAPEFRREIPVFLLIEAEYHPNVAR